jgi:hypothetical protein
MLAFNVGYHNLPLKFWGEYVHTIMYLINITLSLLLNGKTPSEVLLSKASTYNHLHVFVSSCYACNYSKSYDKIDLHAFHCVFLGNPHGKKC